MVIQLDRCYKISFKREEDGAGANFSILDGFYEVVRSYGWNELNGAGINLQESLLDHAGITDSAVLRSLKQNWANDCFYLCIGMDADRQIWVPSSIIKGYPDPRIGSYKKLGLVLDLGVFANQDDFATLGKDIMNYLRSNYGIDRPDATVAVYGNQWMTVSEYENTDLVRKNLQGLAYTTQRVFINPSETLIETPIEFTAPILAGSTDTVIPGAISDSIKVTYGLDLADIPQGEAMNLNNIDPVDLPHINMQWAYSNEHIIAEYTMIEASVNWTFAAKVLNGILLYTKFTRSAYKWRCGESVIYTARLIPSENPVVYNDSNLTAEIDATVTYNGAANQLTVVRNDVTSVYEFDPSNKVAVDITYRFRNLKVRTESPYSQAYKYAYENAELKHKISALEEHIQTLTQTT